MFVLMEVETLGVARSPWLEGAYALRQRLSAGNRVHAEVGSGPVVSALRGIRIVRPLTVKRDGASHLEP
jgi:hypothetical protein